MLPPEKLPCPAVQSPPYLQVLLSSSMRRLAGPATRYTRFVPVTDQLLTTTSNSDR